MRKILLGGIAALMIATPAFADVVPAPVECQFTDQQFIDEIKREQPANPELNIWSLDAEGTKKFADYINSGEPETNYKIDRFLFAEDPTSNSILVAYIFQGCVFEMKNLEGDKLRRTLFRVLGGGQPS